MPFLLSAVTGVDVFVPVKYVVRGLGAILSARWTSEE